MTVAQIIRFDERQAVSRQRRKPGTSTAVILQFPRMSARPAMPAVQIFTDEDRNAGRGRDPG
jgi:hypothetical protein